MKQDGRKNNGGKRNGSGRKKIPPGKRKKPITVFVENDVIRSNGGGKAVKKLFLDSLEPA